MCGTTGRVKQGQTGMVLDRQNRSQGTGKESGQADNTHSPDNNKQSKRRAAENRN